MTYDPTAASGNVKIFTASASYDAPTHTLTLMLPSPTPSDLSLGDRVSFEVPDTIDDDDNDILIADNVRAGTNELYDQDANPLGALHLTAGRWYEIENLIIGGSVNWLLNEPLVATSGFYPKYALYTIQDPNDDTDDSFWMVPTEAQFLDTSISTFSRSGPLDWPDAVSLPMRQSGAQMIVDRDKFRAWFAVPYDDIERIVPVHVDSVQNRRQWFGTPTASLTDANASEDPQPLMINGQQFYAYGNIFGLSTEHATIDIAFNLFREGVGG